MCIGFSGYGGAGVKGCDLLNRITGGHGSSGATTIHTLAKGYVSLGFRDFSLASKGEGVGD